MCHAIINSTILKPCLEPRSELEYKHNQLKIHLWIHFQIKLNIFKVHRYKRNDDQCQDPQGTVTCWPSHFVTPSLATSWYAFTKKTFLFTIRLLSGSSHKGWDWSFKFSNPTVPSSSHQSLSQSYLGTCRHSLQHSHKLESRLPGEISMNWYIDDSSFMAESEEELRASWWKWKSRVKKLA